jgi:origin recognition complex subunit 3
MCHFYANPLTVLLTPALQDDVTLQPEHFEAVRNFPSFRSHIEQVVEQGNASDLLHAKEMIDNDAYLFGKLRDIPHEHATRIAGFLRALLLVQATGAQEGDFSRAYVNAMEQGIIVSEDSRVVDSVRRMDVTELIAMLHLAVSILKEGDTDLALGPSTDEKDIALVIEFANCLEALESLKASADEQGITIRSKYSGQSKVMRTTVIAQRVQLSQDSATLTDQDKQLTEVVDRLTSLLVSHIHASAPRTVLFSESWFYDSRTPWRDVFVPRPRVVLERSLTRPHDYLSCSCCKEGSSGLQATLPATSILYHLYLETGNLMNVADLWTAFVGLVGEAETDERKTLVLFYRALAELRALGFVKASKKKADHIAKLKWL